MIYLSAQPDSIYYAWQVEIMLENFISKGIEKQNIHIVVGYKEQISNHFKKLRQKYNGVGFYFYPDYRPKKKYIPSIRPFLLFQHFKKNWQLKYKTIFYHDCDIVFTRKPQLNVFKKDDIWYQSDTNSYLNYDYIKSKGQDVLDLFLKVGKIDEQTLIDNNYNSGGAQTILKNVDCHFWLQVYILCEELYTKVRALNMKKTRKDPKHHPIQIWCADMWALNFTAWKNGHQTKTNRELAFTWATCGVNKWHENLIYHNAGVTGDKKNLFMKNKFTKVLPYFVNIDIDTNKANSKYYDLVRKMRTKSCLV